ncbi:sulfurtransferase TusA family protein [Vibrio aphrogenes]|uniref:sulfurtransferase TusA family protein n=1 Tax=Vibrio aphrogenes TaxID=1891186 RepID=UPI000B354CDA|nr:sulfurtransferase TusA family protein [Vibrio aphrogenes]
MKDNCLDLRAERCPMALLLAKRHSKTLQQHQSLTILSHDQASVVDMTRYFSQYPYSVEVQQQQAEWTLLVTKKEQR